MTYYWDTTLETGNADIDGQHKELFVSLNELIMAHKAGMTEKEFYKGLDFLIKYALSHFSAEEKLMEECNFPELIQHKKCHEGLGKKVKELNEQFNADGYSDAIVAKTIKTLEDWLKNHIKNDDFKIAYHIKSQNYKPK